MSELKCAWIREIPDPKAPIYMSRAYQEMLATHDGAQVNFLRLDFQNKTGYLPLLIKDVGVNRKEAYSAYGYGGLFGNLSLSIKDIEVLCRFLSSESVICVFIRHSPFVQNERSWPAELIEINRHTYAISLQSFVNFDDYLKQIPQKLRWSVNFARRAGFDVKFTSLANCEVQQIKKFYKLYAMLMLQKQTSDYYLFSEKFFVAHMQSLGDQCELAEIQDPQNGELIAAAFFMLDVAGWAHYHLSAAQPNAMKRQGMELLLASAIYRYGNSGKQAMHLGGGHRLDESDGLSRFKAKFSSERLNFFCTKVICEKDAYQEERGRLPLMNSNHFLLSDARG